MNILTIDLEDWFHIIDVPSVASVQGWEKLESRIERNAERILETLATKNIRATWFCLGWVGQKYPALVRKIAGHHEIGAHSMHHELLYVQGKEKAEADIRQNISILENIIGRKVTSYRAPSFSFNSRTKWLVEVLAASGITHDCSVFPANRKLGGYREFGTSVPCRISASGVTIKEFPMSAGSVLGKEIVFSGGGYFRLLPYELINKMMNERDYNMTYFHPRDFDCGQPYVPGITMKRKFMSYVGLKKSFDKFNRLLNDHKFVSVGQADSLIDWEKVPVVNLEKL
jgi:peptidoglycan-N-acetylglucosamine deacetylase